MRISVTERQSYKRCRRRWDYTSYNRQSLAPIVNAPALDLGTLIHATLAWWTDQPQEDPLPYYQRLSQEYFQGLVTLYTQRVGCAPSSTELAPTMDAIALGLYMIENYKAHWHTPLPPGFTLIQNELSLVQPIPGTQHCGCMAKPSPAESDCPCAACILYEDYKGNGGDLCMFVGPRPTLGGLQSAYCSCVVCHELECTFDGVMADEHGDLFIIERKTFSRTPSVDELNNNDQFLAYQWALTQSGMGNVVGVAYDGLLKKPKPSGVHNTLPALFLRRLLLRPREELEEFGQMLAQEALEMANNPPIYKTVPPVQGCQRWECSFLELCHATSKGEPTRDLLKMFTRVDRKSHLDVVESEV